MKETKIKVRYVETDQMGIVHHSNYFAWFEVGRTEFFNDSDISYRQIEEMGILFPLIECQCKFYESAKYEDELIIRTKAQEVKGVRAKLSYEVIRDSDKRLIAEGYTVHVFTNKELNPINLKKVSPKVFKILTDSICN